MKSEMGRCYLQMLKRSEMPVKPDDWASTLDMHSSAS